MKANKDTWFRTKETIICYANHHYSCGKFTFSLFTITSLQEKNDIHFLENTNSPSSLYLNFTVRTIGPPLKDPVISVCFQGAFFRKEPTSASVYLKQLMIFLLHEAQILISAWQKHFFLNLKKKIINELNPYV